MYGSALPTLKPDADSISKPPLRQSPFKNYGPFSISNRSLDSHFLATRSVVRNDFNLCPPFPFIDFAKENEG